MKITLDDLFQKNPCNIGLHLFSKLKLQNIDFDKIKEIKVYTDYNYLYLKWLCEKFNLTLTIIYDKYKSIYKSGKLTHYENSIGYTEDYKYNKLGLKTHYENSTGLKEDWKYNKLGLKIHYEDSTEFTKDYKYNKNNELIDFISNNEFTENDLKYELK